MCFLVRIKNEWKGIDLNKNLLLDCDAARGKFASFEFAYRVLRPDDIKYLRKKSVAYKKAILAVQELILPAVHKHCPRCDYGTCCRLYTPELSIYIAGSVGCFTVLDYLLVRCDTELPEPNFDNNQHNLCVFWDNGCRLRLDCRSLLCLKFFCEPICRDLDMDLVSKRIAAVQSVVDNFSISQLLQKQPQ
jgi:hypothetical protein